MAKEKTTAARESTSAQAECTFEPQHKIGIKEGSAYMLGDAANLFNLTYISSYLKVFFTDVLKISPSRAGWLFIFTRLWDCINDPIWGGIVARHAPNKDGKFRPYLKWMAIPMGLTTILCFVNYQNFTTNQTYLLIIAYATYIVYGMMYTAVNIPFGSLASVMTDDPHGRNILSTFRSIGGGVGGAVVSLLAPMIIYVSSGTTNELTGNETQVADGTRMFYFALAMGVLSTIFYYLCYKTTREQVPSEAEPKVDMKKTYKGMLKSRPFMSIAMAGVLISGQLQFNSYNTYLYKNYFENTNLSIVGTICNYLPMVILIPFIPKLVKRFGKKELCEKSSVFAAISAVLLAFLANNDNFLAGMTNGIFPAWLFMLFLFAIGTGYTFVSLTCWAVLMDVIDFQEFKTGIRNESAIYAVYTFARKLGQTIADASGLFLLQWAGYDADIASLGFIDGVSQRIMLICTVIPAIVYTGVFLLMKFGYTLTKTELVPIYEHINEKRAIAQAEIEAEA